MRQIILDTETTGLKPSDGHRVIEIGCVEMINRRLTHNHYHQYIQPEREVEAEALAVHGISNEFLADKPVFADIAEEFLQFIQGAELIIHNAPFDVGFLNHEFNLLVPALGKVTDFCQVIDTLTLARKMHPGQRNSLDALCKRYDIDNSQRELHGALLDSEILAEVYLAMTGGQVSLNLATESSTNKDNNKSGASEILTKNRGPLNIIKADADERDAHQQFLQQVLGIEEQ